MATKHYLKQVKDGRKRFERQQKKASRRFGYQSRMDKEEKGNGDKVNDNNDMGAASHLIERSVLQPVDSR